MTAAGDRTRRPSLVDGAEEALRNWLAPGRHRSGDRLPPEHDLSAMLGVSRGTLRSALGRLEEGGEIVRRQGSGTYVGQVATPTAFDERLERLESYASLARRRGVKLAAREVRIDRKPVGTEVGRVLELDAEAEAVWISRVLLVDGEPGAVMEDIVHPDVELPADARLKAALEHGEMVLDVLLGQGMPVAFASTRVMPFLLTPRSRHGRALGVQRPTAVLELEEVVHVASGEAVQRSRDLFAPGGLDLTVIRLLEVSGPAPVSHRPDALPS
ncbi:MAG TPA: GntR family transcriptional regulator [Solirubrobacteraceae bacterium]|nr:GntR family transcriptional regulator [Solirubrobacteraceae bacterium]